jgi:hypothetical protein
MVMAMTSNVRKTHVDVFEVGQLEATGTDLSYIQNISAGDVAVTVTNETFTHTIFMPDDFREIKAATVTADSHTNIELELGSDISIGNQTIQLSEKGLVQTNEAGNVEFQVNLMETGGLELVDSNDNVEQLPGYSLEDIGDLGLDYVGGNVQLIEVEGDVYQELGKLFMEAEASQEQAGNDTSTSHQATDNTVNADGSMANINNEEETEEVMVVDEVEQSTEVQAETDAPDITSPDESI